VRQKCAFNLYYAVNQPRRLPSRLSPIFYFDLFLFLFANLQGRMGTEKVTFRPKELRNRRLSLEPEVPLGRHQARRGRQPIRKEIVEP